MAQSSKTPAELPAAASRSLQDASRWRSGPPVWLGSGSSAEPRKGEKWEKRVAPKPSEGADPVAEEDPTESPKACPNSSEIPRPKMATFAASAAPSSTECQEETASQERSSFSETAEGARAPVSSEASTETPSDMEASSVSLAEADGPSERDPPVVEEGIRVPESSEP